MGGKNRRVVIPDDIVTEILERLPVKSLLRFKCVSKYWYTLIKSPIFTANHLIKQRKILLLCDYSSSPLDKGLFSFHDPESSDLKEVCSKLSVPFMYLESSYQVRRSHVYHNFYVSGPCNGLISVAFVEHVSFLNLALREYKKIPPCPLLYPDPWIKHMCLNAHGFGSTCTGDYKVVNIWRVLKVQYDTIVGVYNLRTNTWKKIAFPPEFASLRAEPSYPQIFFKSACHWQVSDFDFINCGRSYNILSFNLSTESFYLINYPYCLRYNGIADFHSCITVINECLGFVIHPASPYVDSVKPVDVWVMKEYGNENSWTKQFVVGSNLPIFSLLCWKYDEWLLAKRENGQLVAIKKWEMKISLRALTYEESLISLNDVIKSVPLIKLD